MQTMAIGFLPKTLDLDLVIWNIHRSREDNVFLTPKQGDFKPYLWRGLVKHKLNKYGFRLINDKLKKNGVTRR